MKIRQQQAGFVSIMVTMVLLVVVTLILLGFTRLTQREKSQALDRQLSTQAFYAAESGINDAVEYMKTNPSALLNSCPAGGSPVPPIAGFNNDLGNGIKYTCVLITPAPGSLKYDNVGRENPQVVRLEAASGNIDNVQIFWQDVGGNNTFQNNSSFILPQQGSTDEQMTARTGMLRVAVTPDSAALNTDGLLNATKAFFMYPRNGAGSPPQAFGAADADGKLINATCNLIINAAKPKYCRAEISGIGRPVVYLHLLSIYRESSVEIRATNGAGAVALVGEQLQIDVTGKSNDVLRRVQVRRPVRNKYFTPNAAIQSMGSICKRIAVWPGGSQQDCPPDF